MNCRQIKNLQIGEFYILSNGYSDLYLIQVKQNNWATIIKKLSTSASVTSKVLNLGFYNFAKFREITPLEKLKYL